MLIAERSSFPDPSYRHGLGDPTGYQSFDEI